MRKHIHEEHRQCLVYGVVCIMCKQIQTHRTNICKQNPKNTLVKTGVKELTESIPEVTCVAQTGSIIIFPFIMLHKVYQQTVDKERIMISFNYGI